MVSIYLHVYKGCIGEMDGLSIAQKFPAQEKLSFLSIIKVTKGQWYKHNFQGMHTALLKMVFTKIFLVKIKAGYERERYISPILHEYVNVYLYSPWNLSKDVCHVGILIRAGGGIYQIGYSSLWQFILIKKGLIQWFLHSCQVFTVGSHQTWWYSKHIKW